MKETSEHAEGVRGERYYCEGELENEVGNIVERVACPCTYGIMIFA